MDLNVTYSRQRRFHVRNDHFEAGDEIRYRSPTSDGIQKNPSGTYLVTGSMALHNPHRPVRDYAASTGRLGAGAIMPGDYRAVFKETSNLRCFHITFTKDRKMYDVQEKRLSAGETLTLSAAQGVEAFAVMIGEATDNTGKTLDINTLVELTDEDITVTAVNDCVLNVGVKVS